MKQPDTSAVRVALWRALHVELDSRPYVLDDIVGLRMADPDAQWRQRPDMHPQGTRGYRASIVGRARYIEDLVEEQAKRGVDQYVILGAGLDSFAQRRPDLLKNIRVFEIDKPETQAWKRERLHELGFGIPNHLVLVPVDFEAGESWLQKLTANGFDPARPAVIASTGVSMYLTKDANLASLREIAKLAPGSTLAMSFLLTLDLIEPEDRAGHQMVYEKAREAGTPFLSFFTPDEIVSVAKQAGFSKAKHVSRSDLMQSYFSKRADGLKPSSGEEFLVATV